jgi:hypothetical protein
VQLLARDVGVLIEVSTPDVEDPGQCVAQALFDRIVAQDESAAVVALLVCDHGADVADHDVVLADCPVRQARAQGAHGVRPGSNDSSVPVTIRAEQVGRQVTDRIAGRDLLDTGRDETALAERSEQLFRLRLSRQQSLGPDRLVLDRLSHELSVALM